MTADGDRLSLTFGALADPTRRAILARLARGEATVSELAEPFEMTQQAISKHLKVLERAGLISRSRSAQYRPCQLEPEQLDTAADWIDRHRQGWAERFDRLDEHITALRQGCARGRVFDTLMTSDDGGGDYTMRAVYLQVDRPARLAWTEPGVEGGMTTTITFTDLGDGRTEVVTHQTNIPAAYLTPEAQAGFKTSLDRYDAYLATLVGQA